MSLLNKGPSNLDFADGPLLCVECPLRACVRISYMRARARFLVLLNCYMNYLFLSFFRVGRAFFKVEYNINCVTLSQMKITTKSFIQMLLFSYYSVVRHFDHRATLVSNFENYDSAYSYAKHACFTCDHVVIYNILIDTKATHRLKSCTIRAPRK